MTPSVTGGGLDMFVDTSLPAGTMIGGSKQAATVHKSAGAPADIRVVDVSLLGLDVGVYGYLAVTVEYPKAHRQDDGDTSRRDGHVGDRRRRHRRARCAGVQPGTPDAVCRRRQRVRLPAPCPGRLRSTTPTCRPGLTPRSGWSPTPTPCTANAASVDPFAVVRRIRRRRRRADRPDVRTGAAPVGYPPTGGRPPLDHRRELVTRHSVAPSAQSGGRLVNVYDEARGEIAGKLAAGRSRLRHA